MGAQPFNCLLVLLQSLSNLQFHEPNRQFDSIVSQLSGLVAEAGLPSVKKESDKAGDSNNWSRVETARMTSSDTAKITIALFRKDSPDDASGVLMLYMKYYRGVWTVTGHEANGIFKSTGRIGEIGILDSHLELIRAIDRIGSGVPKRQH